MIAVFDGECVLCSRGVAFLLRKDREGRIRFAAMQSETGRRLLAEHDLDAADPETMIVIDGDRCHFQSTAVIHLAGQLHWPWKALTLFRVIPRPLRDAFYRWLARNRTRILGKRESCYVPSAEHRDRFLQ